MPERFVVNVYPSMLQMTDETQVKILASIFLEEAIETDKAIVLFLEILRQQIYALQRR